MRKLKIEDAQGDVTIIPLVRSPHVLTIGRAEGCVIRLVDQNISRFHACVTWEEEDEGAHPLIYDVGSTYGTWVEGEAIEDPVYLSPGVVARIGFYQLSVLPDDEEQS